MKIISRKNFLSLLSSPLLLSAHAQQTKEKSKQPVRVILPYPYTVSVAREVPTKMFSIEGLDFFIENKFGAGGKIATLYMQQLPPNENIMVTSNTIVISNFLNGDSALGADYKKFFKCIGMISKSPFALVAKGSDKTTLNSFISRIKETPGKINYAISNLMDIPHICGEMLANALGLNITAIPYKNNIVLPVLSSEVDFVFLPVSTALPLHEEGQLKILATTSTTLSKVPGLNKFPSLTQYAGFEPIEVINGLAGSVLMSVESVDFYNRLLNQVLSNESYRHSMLERGIYIFPPNQPQEYDSYISKEMVKYQSIFKKLKS